ncbi:hypothetical protein BGZ76_006533, partial [Entomortierella beljakovae]
TAYVYYDEDVYDAVLTDKNTGVTSTTQLLYNTENNVYYIYYRYGDEVTVSEGYETIEAAKDAYQVNYKEKFDVEWTQRDTTVSEKWTYEVKTYEVYETIEEIVEDVDEAQVEVIAREENIQIIDNVTIAEETTITTADETVVVEHNVQSVVEEKEESAVKTEVIVEETTTDSKPASSKGSSWFSKAISTAGGAVSGAAGAVGSAASSAAHGVGSAAETVAITAAVGLGAAAVGTGALVYGAGHLAHGAVEKVDGVWKRTVQKLSTRKAHVDEKCPIAKTAYVYYDEDVYDAVLTDKNTGVTSTTQLLYNTETKVYYVYYRYGDEVTVSEGYETIEAAKDAYQVTYKEKFDVEWTQRETTVSDKWTYEVRTYETFEEIEEYEEVIEESEVAAIVERQEQVVVDDVVVEKETTTTTTVDIEEKVTVENVIKTEVVGENEKEVVTIKQTEVIVEEAAPKKDSWFRKALTATGGA